MVVQCVLENWCWFHVWYQEKIQWIVEPRKTFNYKVSVEQGQLYQKVICISSAKVKLEKKIQERSASIYEELLRSTQFSGKTGNAIRKYLLVNTQITSRSRFSLESIHFVCRTNCRLSTFNHIGSHLEQRQATKLCSSRNNINTSEHNG